MKVVFFFSDLHNEFQPCAPVRVPGADLYVFAGDIDIGLAGLMHVAEWYGDVQTVYTSGNHEFYHMGDINSMMERMDTFARERNILGLIYPGMSRVYESNGERVGVIGGTLWTDYEVFGLVASLQAMGMCAQRMNDHKLIMFEDPRSCVPNYFKPHHALELHRQFKKGMETAYDDLIAQGIEKVVVVTHHGPSLQSCLQQYRSDPLTAGYVTNLENWIMDRPAIKLWIHGHVHNSNSYFIGNCHVVSNPRGYFKDGNNQNPDFRLDKVVEV